MTLTQITFVFLGLMAVIVAAMVIHGLIDKRRIRKRFEKIAHTLSGTLEQGNPFVYPRLSGELQGRRCQVFFQVVKAGRRHILYMIYSMPIRLGFSVLLLKEKFFRPSEDEALLTEVSGPVLPKMDSRYLIRSKEEAASVTLFDRAGLPACLTPLEDFTSVLIGPDSIVIGKPYEGLPDADPDRMGKNLSSLRQMAAAVERASLSPKAEFNGGSACRQ